MLLLLSLTGIAGTPSSRMMLLDSGWKFQKGHQQNAHLIEFDDSRWETVCLPHDWSVGDVGITAGSSPFSKESAGQGATGYTAGGEGWYRKRFAVQDTLRLYSLLFEGVYMEAEVWVNGKKITRHTNGYTPFLCEIGKSCFPKGKENVLAVRVLNPGRNSRWYSGSGIYHHVWLISTGKIHFGEWSGFIQTKKASAAIAEVEVSADVINNSGEKSKITAEIVIHSPAGNKVAGVTDLLELNPGEKRQLTRMIRVPGPRLWSVDSPLLYRALFSLRSENGETDYTETRFGIRTLDFSAEKGFLLNGASVELKGGCIHHGNGLLGVAAIDRAEERKVELLKENGFNAVRCAHNPPSKAFLDACDEKGLLVIDEAFDQWRKAKNPDDYHRFFDQYYEQDLTSMILHDRNHPSVIMWSIGNEIQERADSAGARIARDLVSVVRRYDPSRPVTAAVNDFWDNPGKTWADSKTAFAPLCVAGYNYMWYEYENDHQLFPERVMYGSESVAQEAAKNWDLVTTHPYIIGDFVWTAMDYLGEAGIGHSLILGHDEKNPQFMSWPWFNAWCGDLDICGDKKPQSYFRDVIWGERNLVIAVQAPVKTGNVEKVSYWGWPLELRSWNWKGYEGRPMTVKVYSNPGEVALYLNGKKTGEKKITVRDHYTASFTVPYKPGTLKAVIKGSKNEYAELRTSGVPFFIRLCADRNEINASPNDLAYIKIEALDVDGNIVPDADTRITLKISGEGTIAGSGNASPTDMESFRSLSPRLFRGKALAIIRPNGIPGNIKLSVIAEKMPETFVVIKTK